MVTTSVVHSLLVTWADFSRGFKPSHPQTWENSASEPCIMCRSFIIHSADNFTSTVAFRGVRRLTCPSQILSQRSTGTLTLSRAAVKTPHRGVWGVRRCGRRELCVVEAHILWYLTDGCEATGQCTWTHCKDIHYLKPDSQLEQLKGVFGCHGRIYKWVISIFGFGCKRGKKG